MADVSFVQDVVPFGKYRGKPIDYLINDADYLHWIQDNLADFIQQRHPELYHVVMNNGRRASETPRHNRLQSLFLEDLYRRAFCRVARPEWEEGVWRTFLAEVSHHAQTRHS